MTIKRINEKSDELEMICDSCGERYYDKGEHILKITRRTICNYIRSLGWSLGKYTLCKDCKYKAKARKM